MLFVRRRNAVKLQKSYSFSVFCPCNPLRYKHPDEMDYLCQIHSISSNAGIDNRILQV